MTKEKEEERVQYIIKDTASAVKMRKVEVKAEAKKYRQVVKKAAGDQRLELARLRLQMTAKEAASRHIAVFGPLYLLLLCGGFFIAIKYIPAEQISVVSALLTLLITMIGANLRSIVSEGNIGGKGDKGP